MISFALTGPSGAIDARWGDDPIVGPAIGYIVPVQPLERFTQYTASVTWQLDTGETHTQTVPFTTGDTLPKDRPVAPPAPGRKNPRLHVRLGHFGHRVTAEVTVLLKARGRVTVRARNGHSARRLGKGKASTFGTVRRLVYAATLPRGSWRVVVRFSGTHRWGSRALARRVRIR
jgi:hypothetical protein